VGTRALAAVPGPLLLVGSKRGRPASGTPAKSESYAQMWLVIRSSESQVGTPFSSIPYPLAAARTWTLFDRNQPFLFEGFGSLGISFSPPSGSVFSKCSETASKVSAKGDLRILYPCAKASYLAPRRVRLRGLFMQPLLSTAEPIRPPIMSAS
jgi:hypothetical protein